MDTPVKNPNLPQLAFEQLAKWLPSAASKSITILSVDQQNIKLLHAAASGRGRAVNALICLPLQESDPVAASNQLKKLCKEQGIEPETVLIANPTHLTTMRVFSVPSANSREISDIVDLQAEKHTPYSKDEILTDFSILESDPSGYSKVLLVISHNDVVNRALRLIETMEWSLDRVGLAAEGLVSWLRIARPQLMKTAVALVDIDVDVSTAVVLEQGRLLFSRSLPFGIHELIAEPSGMPSRLVGELRRTLEVFEAEGWKTVPKAIVLTGQVERLPDLAGQIQKNLDIPAEAVTAVEHFTLSPAVLSTHAEAGQVSFASLLGLAASSGSIDLTPKALRLHRAFELRTRSLITLGCQCLALLVLAAGLVVFRSAQHERERRAMKLEAAHAEQEANDLDFSLKQVELVRSWLSNRGQFLDLMLELNKQSSDAIKWDNFDYAQSERLVLKGTSTDMSKVYDLVAALEKSPLFSKVETRKVTKRRDGEANLTSFELSCDLKVDSNENS